MRFLLFFLFVGFGWGLEIAGIEEFYQKLFQKIFIHKPIKVFVAKKAYRNIFAQSREFQIVSDCDKADFIFGEIDGCEGRYRFVLSYEEYKKDPYAFGAFYWRKGRPQLILRKRLLVLINPKGVKWFKRYLED